MTGKTNDIVGAAVGMSGMTYQRAKAVVLAAERGVKGASDALEEMDGTGKVLPSYNKIREHAPGHVQGKGRSGQAPRHVKSPAVLAGEQAVGNREALEVVTKAANAALAVKREREQVLGAVSRIALNQDVERYALHVAWAVAYLQRVEVALRDA